MIVLIILESNFCSGGETSEGERGKGFRIKALKIKTRFKDGMPKCIHIRYKVKDIALYLHIFNIRVKLSVK